MLYNPNNVAVEASPVTTRLELEVAQQLARMVGYDAARRGATSPPAAPSPTSRRCGSRATCGTCRWPRPGRRPSSSSDGASACRGAAARRSPSCRCGSCSTSPPPTALDALDAPVGVGAALRRGARARGATRSPASGYQGSPPAARRGLRGPAAAGRGAGRVHGALLVGEGRAARWASARGSSCTCRWTTASAWSRTRWGRGCASLAARRTAGSRLRDRVRHHGGERGGPARPGARGAGARGARAGRGLPPPLRRGYGGYAAAVSCGRPTDGAPHGRRDPRVGGDGLADRDEWVRA